jgi:prepilin-type N-terminal cleavage/methylation domain-containing protein
MQTLHTHRSKVRAAGRAQAGFTLIEMMVVIAVLGVLAAAVFAGFRQDDYQNQYERFVQDVEGLLVTARDTAIDRQTQVQVTVNATQVSVSALDQAANTWQLIDFADVNALSGRRDLISGGSNVCVYGLQSGVQTPSQAGAYTPPSSCSGLTQTLQFEPDGSFSDFDNNIVNLQNAGVTMWIADQQESGNTKLSIIQLFPGGLIRAFIKTEAP